MKLPGCHNLHCGILAGPQGRIPRRVLLFPCHQKSSPSSIFCLGLSFDRFGKLHGGLALAQTQSPRVRPTSNRNSYLSLCPTRPWVNPPGTILVEQCTQARWSSQEFMRIRHLAFLSCSVASWPRPGHKPKALGSDRQVTATCPRDFKPFSL